MRRVFEVVCALALAPIFLLCAVSAGSKPETDESGVREAFAAWSRAVKTGDAAAVSRAVSQATTAHYAKLHDLAVFGSEDEVDQLAMVDFMQVLLLRLQVPSIELAPMQPPDVISRAVKLKFVGTSIRGGDRIEDIHVEGDRAEGRHVLVGGQDTLKVVRFARDADGWRVDLSGELEQMQRDLERQMRASGKSASALAFLIIELRLARKLEPADFDPPMRRTSASGEY